MIDQCTCCTIEGHTRFVDCHQESACLHRNLPSREQRACLLLIPVCMLACMIAHMSVRLCIGAPADPGVCARACVRDLQQLGSLRQWSMTVNPTCTDDRPSQHSKDLVYRRAIQSSRDLRWLGSSKSGAETSSSNIQASPQPKSTCARSDRSL